MTLASCRKAPDSSYSGNGILNQALSGEISTLDPANAYDVISASIIYQSYEQLYEYHYLKRPYTLTPLLAEDLPSVDQGGKRYTIKIKKGIRYHDDPVFEGKPRTVKAEDFITQIKRLAYPPTNSNGWWLFDGKIKGINEWRNQVDTDFGKFKSTPISGVSAPDEHTLVIELNEPFPQMLFALTMSFTSPMPLEAVEKYENLLHDRMIGTGPFRLEKYNPLSGAKLVRFENYHEAYYPKEGDRLANSQGLLSDAGKRLPFLDGIQFSIVKESQTRWLSFMAGKIDVLSIPKDNYASAIDPTGSLTNELKAQGIQLQIFPTLTYWWLSFNMRDPLVGKNKNLRLAIAHAIDNENYIQTFTNNIGQKANSIYPPGIPGYDPASQLPYSFNLDKAKSYLKLAGYPEGKGLPTLVYDVRGTSATQRQQADYVKTELGKIGIEVKVILNSFPAFLEKARKGELQFWQDGWAMDYPDAENVLQLLSSKNLPPGPNATYYSNKQFDDLFDKMKLLPEGREKWELMREMEAIVYDDLPWVMQYYARNYILYQKRLKNYRHSDLIYNSVKYLRVDND
jgi:ABC-type transport system substrate-binding protein